MNYMIVSAMENVKKSVYYNYFNIFYTFTLDAKGEDDNTLTIEGIRKDNYALWKSHITSTVVADLSSSELQNQTLYIDHTPADKFNIFSDFINGSLKDQYQIIFPTDCDDHKVIIIELLIVPPYGKKTTIKISLSPEIISKFEKIEKTMHFAKEDFSKKILEMDAELSQQKKINGKLSEIIEDLANKINKYNEVIECLRINFIKLNIQQQDDKKLFEEYKLCNKLT